MSDFFLFLGGGLSPKFADMQLHACLREVEGTAPDSAGVANHASAGILSRSIVSLVRLCKQVRIFAFFSSFFSPKPQEGFFPLVCESPEQDADLIWSTARLSGEPVPRSPKSQWVVFARAKGGCSLQFKKKETFCEVLN